MNFLSFKSKDIGIDLGTANILVTINGKGIVVREPSVISVDAKTGNVIATGFEAKEMVGRTPKEINAIKPLKDGVIADFTATKLLLNSFLFLHNLQCPHQVHLLLLLKNGSTLFHLEK